MSYPAPPPATPSPDRKPAGAGAAAGGFFNDLFDVRFTRFVSLRLISIVYLLILVGISVVALAVIFTGFAQGIGAGLFSLIAAGLGWVIFAVLARVGLEAYAVLFRIHDDTSRGGRRPRRPGRLVPPRVRPRRGRRLRRAAGRVRPRVPGLWRRGRPRAALELTSLGRSSRAVGLFRGRRRHR